MKKRYYDETETIINETDQAPSKEEPKVLIPEGYVVEPHHRLLNLRSEPNSNSENVIEVIDRVVNPKLDVLSEEGKYYRVRSSSGMIGYVLKDLVYHPDDQPLK